MDRLEMEQIPLLPETPLEFSSRDVPLASLPADAAMLGAAPDPALVASIRRHGVLQPVLLLRTVGGALVVAEGRRRVKAARLAGLDVIPARVADGDDDLAAAFALVAHGTRHDNPAAELDAIERLLALGATESVIAGVTGLRPQTIRQRLRLRQLDGELREALRLGRMAMGVAEQAAKLPESAQRRLAVRLDETGKVTAADVAAERQARAQEASAALPFFLLTASPTADEVETPPPQRSDVVFRFTSWLETALQPAERSPVRDVVALGGGTLLVQLDDGAACTIQVSAGVPAYAEVA